jgi:proline iminopeptidase
MDGFIDVNGASFYYKAIGRGEPVLVLHGGPGLVHRYLLPGLPRISDRHQFIFLDQRSCGKTESPFDPSRMTVPQFVDDIEAIRKTLHIDRMNLMGHSWGGLLALFYAVRYPNHLKSLILISTAGASSEYLQPMAQSIRLKKTAEDRAVMVRLESTAGFEKNPGLVLGTDS